ncbi:DUF3168 domain-containing protein [Roseibium denhamense]|uniref:DUF3168 domain-containing protein n=1 Tax=Roseibium denhamense TaxID=76305 RepID=A0ABY1PPG4_9HYPH|nr:DUF3168 domain-containing protein [Roseibium denhamense]MTI05710.1 DUF3168 domain-containing protein [Roseibium denhamense]SMP36934.1 Protein of unknown function [Roseibium denhamense]
MSLQNVQTALREALFSVLEGDGTLSGLIGSGGIFDAVPRAQAFPYLVLEVLETKPLLAEIADGAVHELVLSVFSRGPSRDEAADAAGRAADILMHGPVTLSGHRLVNLTLTNVVSRKLRDGRGFRAACAIRAVTEPLN